VKVNALIGMWTELKLLWDSVRDPEYLYLLLEPLPLFGLGIGLIFLIGTLATKQLKAQWLALFVICLSCSSVWLYEDQRSKATPRIVATRDPSLAPLIREQTARRAALNWVYYAMAGFSALTLALQMGRKGKPLLILTAAGSFAVLCLSLWLHKKECEVYHRNIVKTRSVG